MPTSDSPADLAIDPVTNVPLGQLGELVEEVQSLLSA